MHLGGWNSGTRRLTGYHYREQVLPVDRTVSVLGTVSDEQGEFTVAKNHEIRTPYVISFKSGEEFLRSTRRAVTILPRSLYACAPLGAVLTIVGFIVR